MSSSLKQFWREWFILVALSASLLALDSLGWLLIARKPLEILVVPLESSAHNFVDWIHTPITYLKHAHSGLEQISNLQARLGEVMVDQAELNRLRHENEELRKLMGVPLPPNWKFLTADVVGRSSEQLIINRGIAHGLKPGLSVVFEQHLVGVISHTSALQSRVRLLTAKDSRIQASIKNNHLVGIAQGTGFEVQLTQVLQATEIKESDVVVSAGDDVVLPGLVIGSVNQLISQENEGYQRFLLKPGVNLGDVSVVFVVIAVGDVHL